MNLHSNSRDSLIFLFFFVINLVSQLFIPNIYIIYTLYCNLSFNFPTNAATFFYLFYSNLLLSFNSPGEIDLFNDLVLYFEFCLDFDFYGLFDLINSSIELSDEDLEEIKD